MKKIILLSDRNKPQSAFKKNAKKGKTGNYRYGLSCDISDLPQSKPYNKLKRVDLNCLNRGILSYFKELLEDVYPYMTNPNIDIYQLNRLIDELYSKIKLFSALPCTADIDNVIFIQLSDLQKLLGRWLEYNVKLEILHKETTSNEKVEDSEVSPFQQRREQRIHHLKWMLNQVTNDILLEIKDTIKCIGNIKCMKSNL